MVDTTTTHTMILDVEAARMVRSLNQAEKGLGTLTKRFDAAAVAAKKMETSAANMNRGMKGWQGTLQKNNRLFQQGSIQLGDFLVQVGGGQNAMLAFGQQANQLAGFFAGPWGIALTLATGVLAAFGKQMFSGSEDAKQLEEALQGVRDMTAELNNEARQIRTGLSPRELALIDVLKAAQDEQARLNQLIDEAVQSGETELSILDAKYEAQQKIVNEAEAELEALEQAQLNHLQAKEEKERLLEVLIKVNKKLAESVDLTARMAANTRLAAEGAAIVSNINANPDFYDPRNEMGVSGDTDYRAPNWNIPDVPITPYRPDKTSGGSGGRGGKTEEELRLERIAEAVTEAQRAYEDAIDVQRQWNDVMVQGGTSAVDGFVDALFEAESSFKDFARTLLIDMGKIIAKQIIMNALAAAFGGGSATAGMAQIGSLQSMVQGMMGIGQIEGFAKGGIVNGPTAFPMSGGRTGLMGEAGKEAIMPLSTGSDGRLGVAGPSIRINNYSGQEVQVTRSDDEVIEIAVGRARQAVAQDYVHSMQSGHGTYAKAMENSYGGKRKAF